jgi:hypothetical protein
MSKIKKLPRTHWQHYKPLFALALAISGTFNMVSTVLAEGTAAGEQITNQATATYSDPSGGQSTTTSNIVVVEVAEIAGITVTGYDIENVSTPGGTPQPGEQVAFYFRITNVGNDATKFSLPSTADPFGPISVTQLEYENPDNPGLRHGLILLPYCPMPRSMCG